MIDAIDLRLFEGLEDLRVERPRSIEIVAEWLLDHHPTPVILRLLHEVGGAQSTDRRAEQAIRHRQIEEVIARRAGVPVEIGEKIAQPTMLPKAAGTRPEPAVSVPSANVTRPRATATAEPELEPPEM